MGHERIKPNMTAIETMFVMSDGNPGAVTVLTELLVNGKSIDPDCFMGGFGHWVSLDSLGIYGPRIWMLYKDVCHQNLGRMIAVLRAYQLGQLAGVTEAVLNHAIDNYGAGLDVGAAVAAVREVLPDFKG